MDECAVNFTAREQAELLPCERDLTPLGPREVAGRTLATLISAGTELNWSYLGTTFPARPGYAAVFEVEEAGAEVTSLKPGDRAYCMGGHRSHQRVSQENALRVPDGLAPEHAVFARLMGVSMSTLTTTTARPPQKVLVTGLGPVGHLAARIFAVCGYEVLGVDPSEARREVARRFGIADVRPAVPLDDPEVAGTVALALECAGHEGAALDACKIVRKRGEVVLVGTPWRRYTDRSAHEFAHAIFHRYAVVRSGWEWEVPHHPQDFRTNSIFGNQAAALRWLAEGRLEVDALYAAASPHDCQRVYQALLHSEWPALAAVFDWTTLSPGG
jgi:threonine dehydrogenase-like Zn-dependent dehydrogenase